LSHILYGQIRFEQEWTYPLYNLVFSTEINENLEDSSSFSFSFSFFSQDLDIVFYAYSFQRKTAVVPEEKESYVLPEIFLDSFLKVSVCCPEEGFSLTCDGEKPDEGNRWIPEESTIKRRS